MISPLFICHGAPTLAIENNEYTQYLNELGKALRPQAIVIFTAHWESEVLTLSYRDDSYETIYDFGGFPPEMYSIQYPAKGSTPIASKIEERFNNRGITTKRDVKRGLDHGSWVVLRLLYPDADIPIVQVSVNPFLPIDQQLKIGEALQGLDDEDILVIGSGGTVHNLRAIHWGQDTPESWAMEFDDWLIEKVQQRDVEALTHYQNLAPHAPLAVPRAEHFVPLFNSMGSGKVHQIPKTLHRSYQYGTLSHIVFQF
ncbi:class III extradiol ring-cleavage dioxygenase [Ammoniphilus sp. CFH 90114]|uniref:DODA-type extradiol aromatic ring-opening family dioxygenase n=1 Tax=Ammoniphilus sp. CFH 90114 TaxID=2493665 RepID=UPI00100FB289|nr:class III extradiol ring-cleavage dioxygenase [Ammoniphilus sp. CFH 90114]RXT13724.1 dioxygenase [Ammoniphilus sp. CFH 90114]